MMMAHVGFPMMNMQHSAPCVIPMDNSMAHHNVRADSEVRSIPER